MRLKITVVEGDGIGPEVTREAVRVLRTVAALHGHTFELTDRPIGGEAIKQSGSPLPTSLSTRVWPVMLCFLALWVHRSLIICPRTSDLRRVYSCFAARLATLRICDRRSHTSQIASASPQRPEVAGGADILIVRELLGTLYFGEPLNCC